MRVLNFGVENLILNKFQEALNSQRRARDDVRLDSTNNQCTNLTKNVSLHLKFKKPFSEGPSDNFDKKKTLQKGSQGTGRASNTRHLKYL